jgi:acyl carrier protein
MHEAPQSASACAEHEGIAVMLRNELLCIRPDLPPVWPDDALFKSDLALDSLDLVELVARVEQRLQMMIPDADLQHFVTLQAMVDYLLGRRRGLP